MGRSGSSFGARAAGTLALAVALAAATSLTSAAGVEASAAPANDFFAFSKTISEPLPYADSGVNASAATVETGEPGSTCGDWDGYKNIPSNTVWYTYSPAASTTVSAVLSPSSLINNDIQGVVAVYEGPDFAGFTQVACKNTTTKNAQVTLAFQVTAGHTYHIQLGSKAYESGAVQAFDFTLKAQVPANDFFAFSKTISEPLPYADSGVNASAATVETGEPGSTCGDWDGYKNIPSNTVWYTYSPAASTTVSAVLSPSSLINNDIQGVVAVYEGPDFAGFTQVACKNTTTKNAQVTLAFQVTAGHTYHIQLGSKAYESGAVQAFDFTLKAQVPANDFFAFSKTISEPLPYADSGVNASAATVETGEPGSTCGDWDGYKNIPSNTVWYTYSPAASTTVSAVLSPSSLINNDIQGVVAVYEGPDFAGFTQVACKNTTTKNAQVTLAFQVTAGHTYHIQLGSKAYESGAVQAFDFTLIDNGAPTVTAPVATLVAGRSIVSGSLPVTFSWLGSAGSSPIDHFRVERSCDGGAWTGPVNQGPASTTISIGVPSHSCRVRVQAVDSVGRLSAWATSASASPAAYQETAPQVTYHGTWTYVSSTAYSTGHAKRAATAGASATFKFTGRSVAWVGVRCSTCGSAKVYVNGVYKATISFSSTTTTYKRYAWTLNWSSSATRTVKIVVVGTSGHPRVFVDLFAKLG